MTTTAHRMINSSRMIPSIRLALWFRLRLFVNIDTIRSLLCASNTNARAHRSFGLGGYCAVALFSSRSGHSLLWKAAPTVPNGLLKALRTKRSDPAFSKFAWKGQHLACVSTAHSPFKQGSVLVEPNNIPQPFRAR